MWELIEGDTDKVQEHLRLLDRYWNTDEHICFYFAVHLITFLQYIFGVNSKTVCFVETLGDDQMIHLPYCLLSITNPSVYESHAWPFMHWGAVKSYALLKTERMTDTCCGTISNTLVLYRSDDWIKLYFAVTSVGEPLLINYLSSNILPRNPLADAYLKMSLSYKDWALHNNLLPLLWILLVIPLIIIYWTIV